MAQLRTAAKDRFADLQQLQNRGNKLDAFLCGIPFAVPCDAADTTSGLTVCNNGQPDCGACTIWQPLTDISTNNRYLQPNKPCGY